MKLCKDCKHSRGDGHFMECHAPQNVAGPDPVMGKIKLRWRYCGLHRTGQYVGWFDCRLTNVCGKEGRWFAPK